jgi:transposase
MITVPAGIRVLVATKLVDFRRGADRLAALVLKHDPFSGTIYIFRSKRADRLKILAWDGSGLVLFWKRLEHGAFRWPPISDGVMRLSLPRSSPHLSTEWTGHGCTPAILRSRRQRRERCDVLNHLCMN